MSGVWSDRYGEAAIKLWRDGQSANEIAKWATKQTGLEITRNAVIGYIHRKLGSHSKRAEAAAQAFGGKARLTLGLTQTNRRSEAAKVRNIGRVTRSDGSVRSVQPPKPVVDAVVPDAAPPLMVSLIELKAHCCKWPIGDPQEEGFGFCGHPSGEDRYCPPHAHVAKQRKGRTSADALAAEERRDERQGRGEYGFAKRRWAA